MKRGLDWYRRDPIAFLGGVQGLTSKEIAVYTITLDLIYQHGGEVHNDPRWLAGWISDMGAAAVRSAIQSLVEKGKLFVEPNGCLSQNRAKSEAETQHKRAETNKENGKIGGRKSAEMRANLNNNNDLTEANASTPNEPEEIREEESREPHTPSKPKRYANPCVVLQAVVDPMTAQRFVGHLEEKRRPLTSASAEMLVETLRQVQALGGNATDALHLAIKKGWLTVEIEYLRNAGMKFAISAPADDTDWAKWCDAFFADGIWPTSLGPKPGESGCRAPDLAIEQSRTAA